mgnify:CR=1 FL=1
MGKKYDCIFLDRDGTINIDPGYISNVKNFKFYDYTFDALRVLSKLSKDFIIITNQSGVSRGLIKESRLIEINKFISKNFAENNLNLLNIYFCTDHPEKSTLRRKPDVGMFLEASKDYDIKLSNCLMIGDTLSDILPANRLGMDSMLVLSGQGKTFIESFEQDFKPNYITENLLTGAKELAK